jgi:CelD/BcsL family acetyltransferase involved in cellulose biosynthesis
MSSMGRISDQAERRAAARVPLTLVPASPAPHAVLRPAHEAIDAFAAEWGELAAEAAEPNPFAEHWFVAVSLRTLGAGRDIRVIEARRGGRLIGVLPVSLERGYAHLPVRFVQNWYHDHAFLGTPLIAAGEETAFWAAALATLDASDWARNFLHLRGIAEDGPVFRALPRGAIVHRRLRAELASTLSPTAYFEQAVRAKKRKELRRLRHRLAEQGELVTRELEDANDLEGWCEAYFSLESQGWKGREGSGLVCRPETRAFFRETLNAAFAAGRLQFLRLDVGGQPVAMLANLLAPPGAFAFKTVFDERYARFSPGVLLQIENLAILDRPGIAWTDSCAIDQHPMIDGFWTERRSVVRVTVPLAGARRRAVHALCRWLERGSALIRGRKL